MKSLRIFILLLLVPLVAQSKQLPERTRQRVDSLMRSGLKEEYFPGASIVIGDRSGIMYEKCYGWHDPQKTRKVETDDVFDVASVTKVVATTFAVMKLYDQGRIDINKQVGSYVAFYNDTPVSKITLSQLLTHTSGLPYFPLYMMLMSNAREGEALVSFKPDSELYPYLVDKNCWMCTDAVADPLHISREIRENYRKIADDIYVNPAIDTLIMSAIVNSHNPSLRGRYRYSDTNFYILRQIVEKIADMPFEEYTEELFDMLAMHNTGYKPLNWKDPEHIVPTEYDYLMRRGQIHGYVHDDLSALSGSVEGNAGVFSNGRDLANFCEMMLGEGVYKGRRILSRQTVRLFTSSPLLPKKIYRGLGFDKRSPDTALKIGYGHTGYTGTMIWMDNTKNVYMVFLSNRVNPSRTNNGLSRSELRTKIWAVITGQPLKKK